MPGTLLWKTTIAGAIARAVARGDTGSTAYKAAIERWGGSACALKLCADAQRDAAVMVKRTWISMDQKGWN